MLIDLCVIVTQSVNLSVIVNQMLKHKCSDMLSDLNHAVWILIYD